MEKSSASRRDSGLTAAAAAAAVVEVVPSPSEIAAPEVEDDPMDGPLGNLGDAVIEDEIIRLLRIYGFSDFIVAVCCEMSHYHLYIKFEM